MFPIALGTARQDAMISPWGTTSRAVRSHRKRPDDGFESATGAWKIMQGAMLP